MLNGGVGKRIDRHKIIAAYVYSVLDTLPLRTEQDSQIPLHPVPDDTRISAYPSILNVNADFSLHLGLDILKTYHSQKGNLWFLFPRDNEEVQDFLREHKAWLCNVKRAEVESFFPCVLFAQTWFLFEQLCIARCTK